MAFPQSPIHRGTAIETDVEPLVKPAHQRRAEIVPLAGVASIEDQPAAAAPPAERLEFKRSTAFALRHHRAGQGVKSAKPVIGEPQGAVLDVKRQTAGDVADREQHALVRSTLPKARADG